MRAQGVVLGSPVYFMDVTPEMKALIDRAGFVSRSNGGLFRNKVGALVAAARRTGAMHTLDNHGTFFPEHGDAYYRPSHWNGNERGRC